MGKGWQAVNALVLGDTDVKHSKSHYPVRKWAAGLGRGTVGKEGPMALLRQISFRKNNLAADKGKLDPGRPLCVWCPRYKTSTGPIPAAWRPLRLLALGVPFPHPFHKGRKIRMFCK